MSYLPASSPIALLSGQLPQRVVAVCAVVLPSIQDLLGRELNRDSTRPVDLAAKVPYSAPHDVFGHLHRTP